MLKKQEPPIPEPYFKKYIREKAEKAIQEEKRKKEQERRRLEL